MEHMYSKSQVSNVFAKNDIWSVLPPPHPKQKKVKPGGDPSYTRVDQLLIKKGMVGPSLKGIPINGYMKTFILLGWPSSPITRTQWEFRPPWLFVGNA